MLPRRQRRLRVRLPHRPRNSFCGFRVHCRTEKNRRAYSMPAVFLFARHPRSVPAFFYNDRHMVKLSIRGITQTKAERCYKKYDHAPNKLALMRHNIYFYFLHETTLTRRTLKLFKIVSSFPTWYTVPVWRECRARCTLQYPKTFFS